MKRERNRKIRDYSKYDLLEKEYHGLIIEKDKLRIDVRRLKKTGHLFESIVENMSQIPRNTAYFSPKKKKRHDYRYNMFSDRISLLRRLWTDELKGTVDSIKTPEQAGEDTFLHNISFGILDHSECETMKSMTILVRSHTYETVIKMIYAQFLLYIGCVIESELLNVMKEEGHEMMHSGKKEMNDILKKYGTKMKKIPNHDLFDKFYSLWNFMKHSSMDSFKKLKRTFPEILRGNDDFVTGHFSFYYLKLKEQTIYDILDYLNRFFESFCRELFKEDPEEASWNYDDYFIQEFKYWKEGVENPLGIPDYL